MSYSSFKFGKIWQDYKTQPDKLAIQQTNEKFEGQMMGQSIYDVITTVSVEVQNTGDVTACEVAQLYVEMPPAENQPPRQLRGFYKAKAVTPGEKRIATFPWVLL